jgi:TadE-like protein
MCQHLKEGNMHIVKRFERGQAAVEAAITMPLVIFMVLGTLQLFLLLQGRLFAEHAAYAAVRAGSVHFGNCQAMKDAALAALLPNIVTFLGDGTPGANAAEKMSTAYSQRRDGAGHSHYFPSLDAGHDKYIFVLDRPSPTLTEVTEESEHDFDTPGGGYRLEATLTYWYALKIPFANWVMATMFRAYFSLGNFTGVNPLMPTQTNANWTAAHAFEDAAVGQEFLRRYNDQQYSFPVTGSYGMRMMTPPRSFNFQTRGCAP